MSAGAHLREVRLERYGAFTGATVAFDEPMTVVAGPNEAGKSTLLAAIGDLLWGIELRSPYAFEHARQTLRIGARWEGPGGGLDLARTARALLGPDGEAVEAPWGTAEGRAGWEQRLGLSHEQLREGGRAVLTGGGDLAALVFTAHHGSGLQAVLEALDAEADRLWRPRGTKVAVRERALLLEQARADLAAAETRAGLVEEARARARTAEEQAQAADEVLRDARRRAGAAEAAAKALPRVREVQRLRAAVGELLGEGPVLTAEDVERFDDAGARRERALAQLGELDGLRRSLLAQRAACAVDAAVLAAAAEIDEVRDAAEARALDAEQAAEAGAGAETADAEARAHLRELGVTGDATGAELLARVHVPADVAAGLSELATRCTGLTEALHRADEALAQARDAELRDAGDAAGFDEDAVAELTDLVTAVTGDGSAATQWRAALSAHDTAAAAARRAATAAGALDPAAAVPVLDAGEVRRQHAALLAAVAAEDAAVAEHRRCTAAAEAAAAELARHDRGTASTCEDLRAARAARDEVWLPAAARGILMADEAAALTRALTRLDVVTDELLADAEAAARHDLRARALDRARAEEAAAGAARVAAGAEAEDRARAWRRRWAAAGVSCPADEDVTDVLRLLAEAREAAAEAADAAARASLLRGDVEVQREHLLAALRRCGADLPAGTDLDTALVAAGRVRSEADEARERRALARDRAATRRRAEEQRQQAADQLRDADTSWCAAVAAAGLPATLRPAGWAVRLRTVEEAAAAVARARQLHSTHQRLARRVAEFEQHVTALAARLRAGTDTPAGPTGGGGPAGTLPALSGAQARAAVTELSSRLADSRADARVAADLDARLTAEALQRAAAESGLHEAEADLDRLRGAALRHGTRHPWPVRESVALPDAAALAAAAGRSRQVLRLRAEETAHLQRLAEDHEDVAALLADLAGRDDTDVATDAEQLDASRADAERAYRSAQQELGSAGAELRRLESADDANVLGARAAEALAGLAEATERFVVVDLQRRLLRQQLEEFASRRANPLLEEAGALLAALTGGRWTGLSASDDGGSRQLLVRRGDGLDVAAGQGLSEGTADQVFLALRLAAIAQQHRAHLAQGGTGLPVVLDDVLMTFDEHRVEAALRVLRDLSREAQVIVLTHHAHVAEAAAGLGGVGVTGLPGPGRLTGGVPAAPAPRRPSRAADVDPQLVRAWARRQGHEVGDRGRVPQQLVHEYKRAHGLA